MEIDYEAIHKCLENDSRVIQLPASGQAVFVGDTHGDLKTTQEVLDLFFSPATRWYSWEIMCTGAWSLSRISRFCRLLSLCRCEQKGFDRLAWRAPGMSYHNDFQKCSKGAPNRYSRPGTE